MLKQQATQLVSADAIFIQSPHRLEHLGPQQKSKLAFILHTVYQMHDLALSILESADAQNGEKYLESTGYLEKPLPPTNVAPLPRIYLNLSRPKVCIGIPAYNEEMYIRETLLSLKKQDIDGVKFLISDNASSDKTLEIARSLSSDDGRFELVRHSENIGAAENFIKLFQESESEYFMWLGAHDYLSENYLQEVVDLLDREKETSMACGTPFGIMDGKIFGPTKEAIYDFTQKSPTERYLKSVAELANCTIFHSLFRRTDLNGFSFRKTISFDHVLISHLLWKGKLNYAQDSTYFRRYFPRRETSSEERILGKKEKLKRKDFFEFYTSNLQSLLEPADITNKKTLLKQSEEILKARFPL
ncbi:glycosyltransferase family 2 protein [Azotobacter chroococcum]